MNQDVQGSVYPRDDTRTISLVLLMKLESPHTTRGLPCSRTYAVCLADVTWRVVNRPSTGAYDLNRF
jgi:hypothetical protein